jgi:hypothetical protein
LAVVQRASQNRPAGEGKSAKPPNDTKLHTFLHIPLAKHRL